MDGIIDLPHLQIFPQGPDGIFTVKQGANNIHTSFQYDVMDKDNIKLYTLKIYDKVLDTFGREGTKAVSTRLS